MSDAQDLQQPVTPADSSPASASPAPVEPSENWEARFKGLQREYNTLKNTIAGKDTRISTLERDYAVARQQMGDLSSTYEAQLGDLRNQHTQTASELDTLRGQVTQFEQQNTALLRDQEIRKELGKPGNSDLLPWYDAGFLQIGDKTGEELTTYLNGFRDMLQNKSAADFQQTMQGVTPPQISPAGATPGGMNAQELHDWLMANPAHPQFEQYHDQYLDLISRQ
jgi:hypothetical protein